MASKQVIETNKLKIGSSGMTGLFVGSGESKYAVVTDSAKTPTVIYDKVTYNFAVNDLTAVVPASGGTYNITASVSTRTHGNGAVDNVSFSPTSITIPANQGDIYSSAITVTQASSNLTDQFNFTVTGEVVTQITLTLGSPAVIPASGGTVNSATTSATVYYSSGRQETSFTPTQVKFNSVSAGTKGTTVSNQTTAGTLTCYIVYEGVTSNTASKYVLQQANAATGSGCTPVTITSPSGNLGEIPASGGSKTPTKTATGGMAWTSYTSTSTAQTQSTISWSATMTAANGFSVNTSTGVISASSKGTTMSNQTTSNTATLYAYTTANGQGRTASTTYYATQAFNHIVSATATTSSSGTHIYYNNIPASASTAAVTKNGAAILTYSSSSTAKTTSNPTGASIAWNRTYTLASSQNGFTAVNSSTGALTATARGTTVGNARTSANVTSVFTPVITHTSTYGGSVVTATSVSCTVTCTQEGNYVTGITVASQAIAYDTIPAGGGSKTPTGSNGTVTYAFSSKSTTTTAPPSSAGSLTSGVTYAMEASGRFTLKSTSTGEVSATTKGTTIENVTSSDTVTKTVSYTWTPATSYNAAGTKTVSGTATTKVKQAGNYVSSLTVTTNPSISYGSAIPAGGGSITPTGGVGAVSYNFTSGSNTATAPGSTYGALTTPTSYAMATGGDSRITLKSTSSGELTGTTKGTTVVGVTSSGTVTKTVTYTWTPTSSYNAGGTITKAGTATAKGTQAANAVVSYTDYQTPTGKSISGSQVPAAGGTSTITWSGTAAQNAKPVYTSTSTGSSYVNVAPTVSTAITGNNAVASKGTTTSNVTTAQTVTGYYWANGKTASTTCYVTQAANAVVSYTDYQTPTGKSISGSQVPAAGGTSTITWSGTAAQNAKAVYTSNATASTYTNVAPTVSTAVTGNSAVGSKGTTLSNATTAKTVTGYYWANGKTASTSCYVTQAANYVTAVEATGTSTNNAHFSYATASAGATSQAVTLNGTAKYTYSSGSVSSSAPASGTATYSRTYSLASSQNGFTAVNSAGTLTCTSRGTTVGNARTSANITSVLTVTYTHPSGINGGTVTSPGYSKTNTCTQEGNYVTGITVASQALAYSTTIPASGGTSSPSGSNGTVTYAFTSKSTTTTTPATSAGSLTSSVTYAMTDSGRFVKKDSNFETNGIVSATTKGTSIENVTSSDTITKTVSYTWTPAASYNAAGTKTVSGTATSKAKQAGNYVASLTVTTNPTVTYGVIPAGGGAVNPGGSVGAVKYTFTSGSEATAAPGSTYGALTTPTSYSMATGGDSRISMTSTSSGQVSGTSKGTTVVGVTSSGTITKTVTFTWTHASNYSAGGTVTKAGSGTVKATQAANAVTGYCDYQTPTGKSISGSQVPAAGGTSTITWSGTAAQNAKAVYTSNATASTYTNVAPSVSTAITGNSAVSSKGTTVSNATTALTVTGYYWANGKTASTTCYVVQAANQITSYTDYQTPTGKSISGSQVPAAGGTSTITWAGTAAQQAKAVYTSNATASTYSTLNPTVSTAVTGNSAVSSKGTTVSNVTTALTVTGYYWANGKTASTTCYVTQAANAIVSYTDYQTPTGKSISGSQVPANGGTSTITWSGTAAQNAKAVYTSTSTASTYTNVAPTVSTAVTGNSAVSSKGTTVSNVTTALTVTGYYWANGKTASTSCYVTQAANAVTGYCDYQTPTGKSISGSQVPAAGGTSTITWSGTAAQNAKAVYTSTSTASTYTNVAPSVSTAITGNNAVASKGTTASNVTTAQTVTGYYWANGKTASTTCYVTQAANAIVSYTDYQTPTGKSISSSQVPAAGGTSTITWSGTAAQNAKAVYTSNATASTYTNVAPTVSTAVTGNSAVGSKGTTISNATTAIATVTGYYWANGKTASTTCSVTQAANYVTAVVASGYSNTTASHFSYANIGADGTKARITPEGTAQYTFSSGSKVWDSSASPAFGGTAAYARANFTLAASQNGFTSVNATSGELTATNRGTTIGNARTSANVTGTLVVAYAHASGINGGTVTSNTYTSTATCTQNGNYVTSIAVNTNPAISYSVIPAGGGAGNESGTDGNVQYTFSSGSNSTTTPDSTYGALSTTKTYSMATGGDSRITLKSTTTGQLTGTTKGTTVVGVTSSGTVTKAVTYTWTPTATYNAAGTKTASKSVTGKGTQAANAVTSTAWSNPSVTFSYPSGNIPASGGTKTPSVSATQSGVNTYTSTSTANTSNSSFSYSYAMTAGNGFSINTSSGVVTAANRTTTTGAVRTSNTIKVTCTGSGSKTATASTTVSQAANAVTSTAWGNVTIGSFNYDLAIILAKGGSVTPTKSASQSGVNTYTSNSTANTTNTSFTYAYAMTASGRFTLKSTSTGEVSATTRGTTIGNNESSPTVTLTVTGSGSKTATATATATQAGNYVTSITVTCTCTFSGTIPASGGSISESGTDATVSKYYFSSGSNTGSTPGSSYGSLSSTTVWSMTAGNGFSLSNYTVTAENRGTTTGNTRSSNTITETAKCWWTHSSTYSAGGTVSAQTTDTDYCVQEANQYTNQVGVVNVTSPSGSLGTIGAGGGSKTPTLSAWQAMASGYTATGLNTWTNTTFTWAFNKSANASLGTGFYFKSTTTGQLSATSRGTTTGNARTSSAVTVYAYANGATGNSTYSVSQEANSLSTSYGNVTVTSPSNGASIGTISAGGGTKTPTLSAWQACSSGYTSGSGSGSWTNTTFTWAFNKSANVSLGNGFYFTSTSTGQISATSRGSTTGTARSSSSVTAYAYANSKTGSSQYYAAQEANTEDITYGAVNITNASGNLGTIPAGGGVTSTTLTGWQACSKSYTSGSGSSAWTNTTITWTYNKTNNAALGTGFYFKTGTTAAQIGISAANRTTTTGASRTSDSVTCYGVANGKTGTTYFYATQQANAVSSWSAYSSYSTSINYPYSGLAWSAGSSGNVITSQSGYGWPVYTSGSKGGSVYASALTKTLTSDESWLSVPASVGSNNQGAVTATTANNSESDRNAYVTCCWRYGGISGLLCSSARTLVNQTYPKVSVLVSSTSFNSNCTYYGDVVGMSNSPYYSFSSDFEINVAETFGVPTTGYTFNRGPSGTLSVYGQATLTRAPSATIRVNGTVKVSSVQASDWNSTSATWFGPAISNLTISPGDSVVMLITI